MADSRRDSEREIEPFGLSQAGDSSLTRRKFIERSLLVAAYTVPIVLSFRPEAVTADSPGPGTGPGSDDDEVIIVE